MTMRPHLGKAAQSVVALLAIGFCQVSMADDSWKLAKDAEGIKVYTRSVENSRLREFKGEVELPSNVDRIVAVLKDADSFQRWMPDVVESKLLTSSEGDQYHYLENAAPWPVSNRDGVYHFTYTRADEDGAAATTVTVEAVPDYLPRERGKVRIPRSDGSWKIVPTGSGVSVTWQIHADPGGSIPAWMANTTVVDTPFKTLKSLRDYVQALTP